MTKLKNTNPGVSDCRWDIPLLKRQISSCLVPEGEHVGALDTAMTDKPRSDWTALVAGTVSYPVKAEPQVLAEPSRLWIRNISYGSFSPRDQVFEIVRFYKRWMPEGKSIGEQINGIGHLRCMLEDSFKAARIDPDITWLPASRNKDSKVLRIESLIRLHLADRLRLCPGDWNREFIKEATCWTGTTKNCSRRDDLLDATSLAVTFLK